MCSVARLGRNLLAQCAVGFCWLGILVSRPALSGDTMRAVLKDGSVSIGEIVPVAMERAIGWRVDGFRDPFAIRMDAVRSINTVGKQGIDSRDQRASGFRFQLQNDGLIAGELLIAGYGTNQTGVCPGDGFDYSHRTTHLLRSYGRRRVAIA